MIRAFALAGLLLFAAGIAGIGSLAQNRPSQRPAPVAARKSVKLGADPEAQQIAPQATDTTVEKLLARPRPRDMPAVGAGPEYEEKRANPVETTMWVLDADLIEHRQTADGDYVLTLRGQSGKTLKAIVVSMKGVKANNRWFNDLEAARTVVTNRLHPDSRTRQLRVRARVTGPGFFGKLPPASGIQQETGVEIHPIIKIEWL